MGKGTNVNSNEEVRREFSWEEVHQHKSREDRWIVIDDNIYDVTEWQKKHPGGAKILGHFAGQDATETWKAFHNNKEYVSKFMKPLQVGVLKEEKNLTPEQVKIAAMREDFEKLRQHVWKSGLMKTNPWFYIAHLVHIAVVEIVAWYVAHYFGYTVQGLLITSMILAVAQAQMGWTQHDYGHQSVFNNSKLNHIAQTFLMCFCKGGGAHWWNFRHFQHHAKPNVFKKDPDITVPQLFMVGEKVPKKWGSQKRGMAPYQHQHKYFWLLGPVGLLPVYFHMEISYFILKHRDWADMLLMMGFSLRFLAFYYPVYGFFGCYILYMVMRLFDSFWFTMVTQMSHLPMEIDEERNQSWMIAQTVTTTNVSPGFFNDWFTGHLNYQIEHHLFPTMPRHNFQYAAPLVRSLCKKHGLPYSMKPMLKAMWDITDSLRKSGQIWYDAYYHT